jgi:hypothetical protein
MIKRIPVLIILISICIIVYLITYNTNSRQVVLFVHLIYHSIIIALLFLESRYQSKAFVPFLLLPPTIYSLYVFLKIGIGGLLTFFEIGNWIYYQFNPETFITSDFISVLSVIFIFIGYNAFSFRLINTKTLKLPSKRRVYILSVVPILSVIYGLSTGSYGFLGDASSENSFIQIIKTGSELGSFIIIYLVYYFYDRPIEKKIVYIFLTFFFILGLAYGHKSTAVIVVLNFFIVLYFKERKVDKSVALILIGAIFLAYAIIQPLRIYAEASASLKGTSLTISDLYNIFDEAINTNTSYSSDDASFIFTSFMVRSNYMEPLCMAIENKKSSFTETHVKGGWGHIALSPIYAVVPRFIWKNKPIADIGRHFSYEIYGSTFLNSIGFTPQGYFYLLNGFFGVVFGFLLIGSFMRVITWFLLERLREPIIYLYLLVEFSNPSDLIWSYFSGIMQSIIFLLIVMFFMYKRGGRLLKQKF